MCKGWRKLTGCPGSASTPRVSKTNKIAQSRQQLTSRYSAATFWVSLRLCVVVECGWAGEKLGELWRGEKMKASLRGQGRSSCPRTAKTIADILIGPIGKESTPLKMVSAKLLDCYTKGLRRYGSPMLPHCGNSTPDRGTTIIWHLASFCLL